MKFFVTAKPNSFKESILKIDDSHFIIAVEELPINGEANIAVIKALAKFLGMAPNRVRLVAGRTSRQKVLEVL